MNVTNTIAHVRANKDVRVTEVTTQDNGVSSLDYNIYSIVADGITFSSSSDTVTFEVTVRNLGNVPVAISNVNINDGSNTITTLGYNFKDTNNTDTYTLNQKICNGNNCTGSQDVMTFSITLNITSGNTLNYGHVVVDFTIGEVYEVTYNSTSIGEVVDNGTFDYTFQTDKPTQASLTFATGSVYTSYSYNEQTGVLQIVGVGSDIALTGQTGGGNSQIINNPDGSVTIVTDNGDNTETRVTTDTSGNVTTEQIEYAASDTNHTNPIVTSYEIDTSGNPNGGLVLNNSVIDTHYVAFDGNDFEIHLVYKTTINNNAQKHIMTILQPTGQGKKYNGIYYLVYKSGSVRVNTLSNVNVNNGYAGTNIMNFTLSTATASSMHQFEVNASYNASTKLLTFTMNPGNNNNTSQTHTATLGSFTDGLSTATINLGGDDTDNSISYNMASIEIIKYSVSRV